MDFGIRTFATFELFGLSVRITETIVGTWIIMAVLIIGAIIVRWRFFKDPKDVPETGLQNVVELAVESMERFATGPLGQKYVWLDNWFFMLILFLLFANISGLFGMRAPTADVATTLAMSTSTFLLVQVMAFKYAPRSHIRGLFEPFPIFFPINLIGELAIIISLSFRMFGNILAGTIILGLVYSLIPWWGTMVLSPVLHLYFDLFAGAIQAFIFCLLSMSFIGLKLKNAEAQNK